LINTDQSQHEKQVKLSDIVACKRKVSRVHSVIVRNLLCCRQSAANWRPADEAAAGTGEHCPSDRQGRHIDELWSETTEGSGILLNTYSPLFIRH